MLTLVFIGEAPIRCFGDVAPFQPVWLLFRLARAVPETRGYSDASGGEHGDRPSVLITVVTLFRVNRSLVCEKSLFFVPCAQFVELRVAPALSTVSGSAPKGEHSLRHAETYQRVSRFD